MRRIVDIRCWYKHSADPGGVTPPPDQYGTLLAIVVLQRNVMYWLGM